MAEENARHAHPKRFGQALNDISYFLGNGRAGPTPAVQTDKAAQEACPDQSGMTRLSNRGRPVAPLSGSPGPVPGVSGYAILGVLGRGGMGADTGVDAWSADGADKLLSE